MTPARLLAEHAAMLKRMIAELEGTLGVTPAFAITSNLLAAYEAIRQEQETLR